MLFKYQKKVSYLIFFILVFFVYDTFTNTYIVFRENYSERMIKNAGFCNGQGYGFFKFINDNYSNKNSNIIAKNFNDMPHPSGYFFNYKKDNPFNEIILIGAKKKKLSQYLKYGFKIIYYENDCYYLKK